MLQEMAGPPTSVEFMSLCPVGDGGLLGGEGDLPLPTDCRLSLRRPSCGEQGRQHPLGSRWAHLHFQIPGTDMGACPLLKTRKPPPV